MSEKKPVPTISSGSGKACPVCGKNSYSRAGIHPQCAAKRSDSALTELMKKKRDQEGNVRVSTSWNTKTCPKCNARTHVRLKQCQCGHVFF